MKFSYLPVTEPQYIPNLVEHEVELIFAIILNKNLSQMIKIQNNLFENNQIYSHLIKQYKRIIPAKILNNMSSNFQDRVQDVVEMINSKHIVGQNESQGFEKNDQNIENTQQNQSKPTQATPPAPQPFIFDPNLYSIIILGHPGHFQAINPNTHYDLSPTSSETPSPSPKPPHFVEPSSLVTTSKPINIDNTPILATFGFKIPLFDLNLCSEYYKFDFHTKIWPLTLNPKPYDPIKPLEPLFSDLDEFAHENLLKVLIRYGESVKKNDEKNNEIKNNTQNPLLSSITHKNPLSDLHDPHLALAFDPKSFYEELAQKYPNFNLKNSYHFSKYETIISILYKHIIAISVDCAEYDLSHDYLYSESFDTQNGPQNDKHPKTLPIPIIPLTPLTPRPLTQFDTIPLDARICTFNNLPVLLNHATMQIIEKVSAVHQYTIPPTIPPSNTTQYLCNGYTLYLTHEGCNMCMMGAVHSRFENVFFLNQTLSGVLCTQYALQALPGINHRYNVYQVWIDEYNREEMGI